MRKKLALVACFVVVSHCVYCADTVDDAALITEAESNDSKSYRKDPFESINRPVFEFNKALDKYVLRSAAAAYIGMTNDYFRECSYNFFYNLGMPLNSFASFCSFDIKNAFSAIARFVINTFLGFFGAFDPASKMGIYVENYDMKSPLKKLGMPGKPYIMLPLLGPSCPRDIIGMVGNFFLDPFGWIVPEGWVWRRRIANVISDRSENYNALNAVLHESATPYEDVRNAKIED